MWVGTETFSLWPKPNWPKKLNPQLNKFFSVDRPRTCSPPKEIFISFIGINLGE